MNSGTRRVIPIAVQPSAAQSSIGAPAAAPVCPDRLFVLFVFAPVFNLLRYDLVAEHAWFLGMEWHIGLDDYSAGRIGLGELWLNLGLRLFGPDSGGWGCTDLGVVEMGPSLLRLAVPAFSVVETINRLMRRATGKPSLWDPKKLPPREPDGTPVTYDARWWLITAPLAIGFAFVWSVVLLTYLLPLRGLWQSSHGLTDPQPVHLHHRRHRRAVDRVPVCPPPVLPLRLRRGFLPEPRLDGQQARHGGRFRASTGLRLQHLLFGLRPRLPDAPQAAQRQAHDVHLHPVLAVHLGLRDDPADNPNGPLLSG